jgi:hypothetical protein
VCNAVLSSCIYCWTRLLTTSLDQSVISFPIVTPSSYAF